MAKDKKSKSEGKKAKLVEKKQKQAKKGVEKERAKKAKANEYILKIAHVSRNGTGR
jgi:hypothetical protein